MSHTGNQEQAERNSESALEEVSDIVKDHYGGDNLEETTDHIFSIIQKSYSGLLQFITYKDVRGEVEKYNDKLKDKQ
tara:strand:- start:730 stop:960 length:231 start_codon:yes stop_codon:yes gene_type:complete